MSQNNQVKHNMGGNIQFRIIWKNFIFLSISIGLLPNDFSK